MLTMYFCYDGHDPVIRCWAAIPRVGDTIALAELQNIGDSFTVTDVVWEGDGEPTLSIHLKRAESMFRRFIRPSGAPTPCNGNGSSVS